MMIFSADCSAHRGNGDVDDASLLCYAILTKLTLLVLCSPGELVMVILIMLLYYAHSAILCSLYYAHHGKLVMVMLIMFLCYVHHGNDAHSTMLTR